MAGATYDREKYKVAIPQLDAKLKQLLDENVTITKQTVNIVKTVEDLDEDYETFKSLATGYFTAIAGDVDYLTSRQAYIAKLSSDIAEFGFLTATSAEIQSLKVGNLEIGGVPVNIYDFASTANTNALTAKESAQNASEYASRALNGLSSVQSVAETLTWITQHGTMALTTDTALDPTHVYFVQDNSGDYVVGGVHYAIVTEPDVADIATYYVLSIDESLNNYVATHMAVDAEGLWLLPETGGNKVLIATGAGSTYTSAGTYIIDAQDNILAYFGTYVRVGNQDQSHAIFNEESFKIQNAERVKVLDVSATDGAISETAQIEIGVIATSYAEASVAGLPSAGTTVSLSWRVHNTPSGGRFGESTFTIGTSATDTISFGAYTIIAEYDGDRTFSLSCDVTCTCSMFYINYTTTTYGPAMSFGTADDERAPFSASLGYNLMARGEFQTVIGKYNWLDSTNKYALIVGNGTSDSNRTNAITVDWSGNVDAAGTLRAKTEAITPTITSITPSTASVYTYRVRRFGNVVMVILSVRNTASIAVGSMVFQATLGDVPLPPWRVTSACYFGYANLMAQLDEDGVVTLRNTWTQAVTIGSTNFATFSFTYIVD